MSDSARIDWTCVDSALAIVNDLVERLVNGDGDGDGNYSKDAGIGDGIAAAL